jgi:hypothetical protein
MEATSTSHAHGIIFACNEYGIKWYLRFVFNILAKSF